MNNEPKVLKWFEVTWITASGRTLVRAEDEGEAKMLASQNADTGRSTLALPGGKSVLHEWFEPTAGLPEPDIFDVEELQEDYAAWLKSELEGG